MLLAAVLLLIPSFSFQAKYGCPYAYPVEIEGERFGIPYCASHDLSARIPGGHEVKRVIVAIHDHRREAGTTFSGIQAMVESEAAGRTTLVVAPQFPAEADVKRRKFKDPVLFWQASNGWMTGELSGRSQASPRPFRISSFEVLDRLLKEILQHPDLGGIESVMITGYAEGAAFVHLYGAGSMLPDETTKTIDFAAIEPPAYLYLSETRRTGITADQFDRPAPDQIQTCPEYNRYPYGLEALNEYMALAGREAILANMNQRRLFYLVEETARPRTASLLRSCAAEMQGRDVLNRAKVYASHLSMNFGGMILRKQQFASFAEEKETLESRCVRSVLLKSDAAGYCYRF